MVHSHTRSIAERYIDVVENALDTLKTVTIVILCTLLHSIFCPTMLTQSFLFKVVIIVHYLS